MSTPFSRKIRSDLLTHGFTVVPNFLSVTELTAARTGVSSYFPSTKELAATPQRYGFIYEDPENLQVEFPFADDTLNDVATHPQLIRIVRDLLGTERVRLSQSAIWAKYAGLGHYEQGLHLDYQGNTLVVPRDDGDYRQVNMILYYTNVTESLGPTHVVSQTKTGDLPLWPTHRWRKTSPSLYEMEQPIIAKAGSLLIFSMRTWHRASAITAPAGVRFSHHFVWRAAAHDFQGYHLYSKHGENEDLQDFITRAKPAQREVLGFPPAGDAYWTDETRTAVKLRYPEMNVAPYSRPKDSASRSR
ncbi:hypothetical protein BH10PLA1_BH10PLA1_08520 [soil metagenome]